jgi:hypothetical protein
MDENLATKFEAPVFEKDNEWLEMHDNIMEIRNENNMTITKFLRSCKLNPEECYYKQLCCKMGFNLHPSLRLNSSGRKFRDAVSNFIQQKNTILLEDFDQPLESVLREWCQDNYLELKMLNISSIYLSKSGPVGIIINAYDDCKSSDNEIVELLMSDSSIQQVVQSLEYSTLFVKSRGRAQLI